MSEVLLNDYVTSIIKSKCIEVYVREVSCLGQAKLLNCNQILDHVADQSYIAFIDSQCETFTTNPYLY